MLEFDHIAISAKVLADGTQWLENRLGLPLSEIGQHPDFGTHNRLLSLGDKAYLEVIAIDPVLPAPNRPRWFGLDQFTGAPRLTNWILRSDDLQHDLARLDPEVGQPVSLRRGDFRWRMAVPEAGSLPMDNLHPALIGWDGPHPAPLLKDQGVRLTKLVMRHPEAAFLANQLALQDDRIVFEDGNPGLSVTLSTPKGEVTL